MYVVGPIGKRRVATYGPKPFSNPHSLTWAANRVRGAAHRIIPNQWDKLHLFLMFSKHQAQYLDFSSNINLNYIIVYSE